VSAQLQLVSTQTPSVPLREALEAYAALWSVRLGHNVRVSLVSNGGGYRIGPS
jgi:hypothetical protein